ncbi:MAG: SIS domain-containing protein [Enhydrobacter sp.]|nr:SIS domain-containing protein [Enhydrobacter sp.]
MNEATRTAMAREIAEIPALAEHLLARREDLAGVAARIARARPRIVVLCGRGSSGHVGVYLRYLFEARYGVLVSAAAPSVITTYRQRPDMRETLFVVISQSGRSPDIVLATAVARSLGALTLALVNDDASPAARAAELVFPIRAGPEKAVAATKTVALSMIAGAQIVAALTRDDEVEQALRRLPERFASALTCDWSAWGDSLGTASAAFVAARGYGFGTAREIALKVTETLRLPALGYSTAELRHGPWAAIGRETPVLVLRQGDETSATADDLVRDLFRGGSTVFSAGGPAATLPWLDDDHPVCDPIAMLLPAYRAIEAAAHRMGMDPDNPPFLNKVTRTL